MSSEEESTAIQAVEEAAEANHELQEQLNKYILDLESEQEKLDTLINNLSKLESNLPDERSEDEVFVDTAPYGENLEVLRHTLTTKQIYSETSPFYPSVAQRQRYELLTTTRPFTREEQRLLHTSVIIENKRLHALRARDRGEDPFAAVESFPNEYFDKDDPEISWASVVQNMSSNPPRTAEQCRITYIGSELPSINRSDWPPDELERLKTIVVAHNQSSNEPVEDTEEEREKLRIDWVEVAQALGTNRTALQCLRKFVFDPSLLPKNKSAARSTRGRATSPGSSKAKANARDKISTNVWNDEEDKHLREGIQRHGIGNWPEVALHVNAAMSGTPGHVARTPNQCNFRYTKSLCPTIKKGKWSQEEDEALQRGVAAFGRTWTKVQEYVEGRTDAQCRERWSNMLDPNLKTGPWDEEEDKILLDAVSRKLPWSRISALLPGRTDNRCAKRYQILIKKKEDPEQEDSTTPATKRPQKRAKNLRETKKKGPQAGGNEAGDTPVAGEDEPSTSSAVLPATQDTTVKPSKSKPKPKPKPKAVKKPVEQPDDESNPGRRSRSRKERQTGENGEANSHDQPVLTENQAQQSPSYNEREESDKQVANHAEHATEAPTLRRSSRVAGQR